MILAMALSVATAWAQQRSAPKKNKVPQAFETVFERSNGLESPTYLEMMDYYRRLVDAYPEVLALIDAGPTDAYYPLYGSLPRFCLRSCQLVCI